jgi:hypothetical protein
VLTVRRGAVAVPFVVIFDDSTRYESYQIHDGDRLIVV